MGTGEREYDWAWGHSSPFGDLPGRFVRWHDAISTTYRYRELSAFHSSAVDHEQVVAIADARWSVEECLQVNKG
ncbi:hypothetical protein IU450_36690 [Nocardia abscessus]|uniref:hypothetical protein n=1 Tax=Nocardia abscessus TaxID=120957 RepID=UPI0018959EED|nr:hypothetical protein [Nocardia abscessus]MBF6341378.1 hypothetical protein [Nocardia abscessus]